MPRPRPRTSYGFPSGHTSTAIALAATLGVVFPKLTSFFYLPAILTGVFRLYFRAHFVWDVVGGALIGIVVGIPIAKKLIYPLKSRNNTWATYLGWSVTAIVGLTAMVFFLVYERSTQAHMLSDITVSGNSLAPVVVDFGTPKARRLFGYGWPTDEKWMNGKLSVVWAEGWGSALSVPFPYSENYRSRLRLFPIAPKGPSCQRLEVVVNRVSVARLHLERRWHSCEFRVPKAVIKKSDIEIEFYFDNPESPKSRGISTDERPLSVAFDLLETIPEN